MKENLALLIPTLRQGGMEKVAANLSCFLVEEYNVYIILYDDESISYQYDGNIVSLKIPSKSKNIFKNSLLFLNRLYKVKKIKKKLNISTTISFSEGPNIINVLSSYGDKKILTVHSIKSKRLDGIYGIVTKILMSTFYNYSDKIITVSKLIKQDLIENFGINDEKISVIYNPLNNYEIDKLVDEEIELEYQEIFKKKVIINIGRLNKVKGHEYLIKSFNLLCKERDDINLLIVGDGELREKLTSLVRNLNLEKRVFLIGFHSNPYKFLKNSDLFVLTSFVEGFPNVIIESLYCGIPIITTDCKFALREVLDSNYNYERITDINMLDYGVLIPDIEETGAIEKLICKAISIVIDDETLKSSYIRKGKKAVKQYLFETVRNEWLTCLREDKRRKSIYE